MNFFSYKNPLLWTTIFLLILLVFYYLNNEGYFLKGEKIVSYRLPVSSNPETFGPPTWGILHKTVEEIPCPSCRNEATSFMRFFHDYVNEKLNKPKKFPDNYNKVLNKLCDLQQQ